MDYAVVLYMNEEKTAMVKEWIKELAPVCGSDYCLCTEPHITISARIDFNKAEDGLKTTPCSQNSLNTLAIDEPLEYVRLSLDGEMQAWVDAIDSFEVW